MQTTHIPPLDHPPIRFLDEPFFIRTLTLLRSVRDRDVDVLDAPASEAAP